MKKFFHIDNINNIYDEILDNMRLILKFTIL
jgi:hypothetical protein